MSAQGPDPRLQLSSLAQVRQVRPPRRNAAIIARDAILALAVAEAEDDIEDEMETELERLNMILYGNRFGEEYAVINNYYEDESEDDTVEEMQVLSMAPADRGALYYNHGALDDSYC